MNTCGDTRRIGKYTWVCIRPPHDWVSRDVAARQRLAGRVINPDRHVYVAVGSQK